MSAYTTEVLDMKLGGMVCHSCEDVIAAALLAERGVVDAEVSYYKSAARVKYDPAIVTPERLEQCVKNAGYGVGGSGLGGVAADAICAAAVILLTWLLTRYAKPGAPVMSAGMSPASGAAARHGHERALSRHVRRHRHGAGRGYRRRARRGASRRRGL